MTAHTAPASPAASPTPGARRSGRPPASSRAMLEEAASELFLERGYAATSVADITQRAGVSRSTFFNYVETKSDLLWSAFDEAAAALALSLRAHPVEGASTGGTGGTAGSGSPTGATGPAGTVGTVGTTVRAALRELAVTLPPDPVALAFTQAEPMGLGDELRQAAARRTAALGATLAAYAVAHGVPRLRAQVAGTAWAGALIAAVEAWAYAGADRTDLPGLLDEALEPVRDALP
ncbi:TetR/AcrR family transcriptional regulator [Cellulomonas hominis]